MPAITALTVSAATPVARALAILASRARRGLKQLAEKVKNRHDAMRLAELDDRMLADIGLSRSDLRDAYALPLWRDPSDVLARRAADRRGRRSRTQSIACRWQRLRRNCSGRRRRRVTADRPAV